MAALNISNPVVIFTHNLLTNTNGTRVHSPRPWGQLSFRRLITTGDATDESHCWNLDISDNEFTIGRNRCIIFRLFFMVFNKNFCILLL